MIETFYFLASQNGAWLITAALIFTLSVVLHRRHSNYLNRRVRDLELANKALQDHSDAVLLVLDDPAPSEDLKRSLCTFSEAVTDRGFARFVVSSVLDGSLESRKLGESAKKIQEERASLAKTYPHLARAFDKASEAGVMALILRWPETASIFSTVAYEMTTDDRSEIQIEANATTFFKARKAKDKDNGGGCDDDNQPFGPVFAPV